jgi:kynureninase
MITRADCIRLDASDQLAALREQFDLPADTIYLDGNSLGARPKAALERARQVIAQEWGSDLIRSWNKAGWFDLPSRLGDKLAGLIGAAPGEVVVTDSTSVNLFKALAAALRLPASAPAAAGRKVIITERVNFPTDLYIAHGLTSWLDRGYQLRLVDSPDELRAAIDERTAVVMLTHVNYRTGHMHDMQALSAHAHACGALTIWDLAHSAGAVPLDVNRDGADFAVGCTYKYLNGGPGAPAFIWVAPRHQADFRNPLSGWWTHAAPFAMAPEYQPATGIRLALCGTQPVVSLAMVECGLDVFAQTTMTAIRAKSLALTDLFIELAEARCARHPLLLATPRPHHQRGSQVSFAHPHGYAVMQALIERGVIGDYREPEIMRFGFTPLYTRFVDVWDAVKHLADILDNHQFDLNPRRDAVT